MLGEGRFTRECSFFSLFLVSKSEHDTFARHINQNVTTKALCYTQEIANFGFKM